MLLSLAGSARLAAFSASPRSSLQRLSTSRGAVLAFGNRHPSGDADKAASTWTKQGKTGSEKCPNENTWLSYFLLFLKVNRVFGFDCLLVTLKVDRWKHFTAQPTLIGSSG